MVNGEGVKDVAYVKILSQDLRVGPKKTITNTSSVPSLEPGTFRALNRTARAQ